MAYNTPATSPAGTPLTAGFLNTYVRDNIAWLATDSPACRAYNNAAISIPNTTETAVTLNSERFDNAAIHSTSSNTSRMTIPSGGGGKYLMGAGVGWAVSASGTYRFSYIRQNGTTRLASMFAAPNATVGSDTTICAVFALSAVDYVELDVQQDSGGALNVATNASYQPEFYVFWFRN